MLKLNKNGFLITKRRILVMSRKLTFILLVLALASSCYAEYLIGNFEDSNDGYRDWGDQSVFLQPPKYNYVTTGATLGSKAVCIDTNAAGWQQNLSVKSYESAYSSNFIQAFLDNTQIAIDITFVASDWVKTDPNGDNWANVELSIQGTSVSWLGLGAPDEDTGNPGYPGGWDDINFGETHTRTMIWDIDFLHNGDYADEGEITATPESGYVNLIWTTNHASNFEDGGVFYIDNIRFIPEPATMIMLGLGGLALRRRKR
jgi:hypothetical protein